MREDVLYVCACVCVVRFRVHGRSLISIFCALVYRLVVQSCDVCVRCMLSEIRSEHTRTKEDYCTLSEQIPHTHTPLAVDYPVDAGAAAAVGIDEGGIRSQQPPLSHCCVC